MKKTRRTLAIILALAMILSVSVFAAWEQHQGNLEHNGQIIGTAPPTSPSPTYTTNSSLGSISAESVMNTESGVTYSYTLTGSGKLVKTNCSTGATVWTQTFTSGYQLSSPCLVPSGTYEGVYISVNGYYELLENTEFTAYTDWTLNNATIDPTWTQGTEVGRVAISDGGSISQTFTYTGSTATRSTELYSQVMRQSGSGSISVSYIVTDDDGATVASYTASPSSSASWTNVEEYFSTALVEDEEYTITVTPSGADVYVEHVNFSWQTNGIKRVSFAGAVSDVTVTSGQATTPIAVYGKYLYYGKVSGNPNYFQIDLSDNSIRTYYGGSREYWAGATVVTIGKNDYVVFGDDGGYLNVTPVGAGFGTQSARINLSCGQIRSTVSQNGDYIYLASKGGYLMRGQISTLLSSPTFASITLPAASTSTPAISMDGYVYVGYYNGFTTGGVVGVPVSSFVQGSRFTVYSGQPVQSSPIVYYDDITYCDYIYFTTNHTDGAGYCYDFYGNEIWKVPNAGDYYALQGFSAAGGKVVYGNDSGTLYIVG